jgi:hypothetical protein
MDIIKGFFLIILMLGIIMLVVYFFIKSELDKSNTKIVYKYIPRTLEEEEKDPIYVSQIFKSMFTQPTVWIDSVNENDYRKTENLNKFFLSQY